ncbi:MAG: transposase [Nannocystis sp.]|nr:transposase [Nannocystis sp.]
MCLFKAHTTRSRRHTSRPSPTYPDRFAGFTEALAFCRSFFAWYNHEHRHSGIAYLTPADVHYGRTDAVLAVHAAALEAAYTAHPERFVRGKPTPRRPPAAVYINPPRSPPKRSRPGRCAQRPATRQPE